MAADQHKHSPVRFDSPTTPPIYSPRSMAGSERSGGGPLNDTWRGMSTGWQITAYMLGGILSWGAVGYLIDWLIGTGKVFTAIGMVAGAAGAVYLVYLHYGRGDERKN
jgi:ATP synthase protein I